jgi:hypothetical protein
LGKEQIGLIKYIDLDGLNKHGDRTVTYINDTKQFIKTASYEQYPEELRDFINSLKSEKDIAYLLISAATDLCWGPNNNADGFPIEGLNPSNTEDYGFKTYEKYGNWYHLHVNKDPKKSYGKVIKSIWDDSMGRILLIVRVDLKKDKDTAADIENDRIIETSMGCQVPYDCCRVCHPNWKEFYKIPEDKMKIISRSNSLQEIYDIGKEYGVDLTYIKKLNPKTSDSNPGGGPIGIHSNIQKYCEHMKNYRGRIYPGTGERVYVLNLRPKFFDISRVRRAADRSSSVLAKVAEDTREGMATAEDVLLMIKDADKIGELNKQIDGQEIGRDLSEIKEYFEGKTLPYIYSKEKEMPVELINELSRYPIQEILSTMTGLGMYPHPREFQRIILISDGRKDIADNLDRNDTYITEEDAASLRPIMPNFNIGSEYVNDDIIKLLMPIINHRSYFRKPLIKRIEIIKHAGEINAYLYPSPERKPSMLSAILPIAALYTGTKIMAGQNLEAILKSMSKKNIKTYAAVLGTLAATGLIMKSDQEYQKNVSFNNARYNEKYAGAKTNFATIVGVPALTYLYAGHIINKAQSGQPINKNEAFIARNPLGVSIGAGLVAHPGSRKKIFEIAKGAIKGLRKAGAEINIADYPLEVQDELIIDLYDNLMDIQHEI